MARRLTAHIVDGDSVNHQLKISTLDEAGPGGAHHVYDVTLPGPGDRGVVIEFQKGAIKEAGANGLTHEALLAIIIDRLECFQNGPFKSEFNRRALHYARCCLQETQDRTRERMARGVEGTHQK